jgi:hypothetical protein
MRDFTDYDIKRLRRVTTSWPMLAGRIFLTFHARTLAELRAFYSDISGHYRSWTDREWREFFKESRAARTAEDRELFRTFGVDPKHRDRWRLLAENMLYFTLDPEPDRRRHGRPRQKAGRPPVRNTDQAQEACRHLVELVASKKINGQTRVGPICKQLLGKDRDQLHPFLRERPRPLSVSGLKSYYYQGMRELSDKKLAR